MDCRQLVTGSPKGVMHCLTRSGLQPLRSPAVRFDANDTMRSARRSAYDRFRAGMLLGFKIAPPSSSRTSGTNAALHHGQ